MSKLIKILSKEQFEDETLISKLKKVSTNAEFLMSMPASN